MARLIYPTNVSLDGYIEDDSGAFNFLPIDDGVFAVHTAFMRSVGTHLYGRRLYEAMAVWETDPELAAHSPPYRDFSAAWQEAAKVVYSTSLNGASTAHTQIERSFDPTAVRELKSAADRDLIIGGAHLADQALRAGLVDEIHLYVLPVIVGGGKPGLPTGLRFDLKLLEQRGIGNGVVLLRYQPTAR
jgi:dihydrofolate reductase